MTENRIYTVATAHLDTVWRWELAKTIDEYLPDTLEKNFELLEKYPHYRFNFEGAFRYELIEEYYPRAFELLCKYAKEGRWCPSGSAYENGDVNIPSPEALLRNFLYGNRYFTEKLGASTTDVFLPDCFGFGYALPSIAKQAHLNGFTTQKLTWGGAYERPFNIGLWQGVDGNRIFASLNPLSYRNKFSETVRGDIQVINELAENGLTYNLPWVNRFYGTGDCGGAPNKESVETVGESISKNDSDMNTQVIAARSDELFNDLEALAKKESVTLPLWNNELLMRSHGVGCYTSRAMSKRLNSQNELLADMCERACVSADLLTSYKYPKENIDSAWKKVIQHQFHDDITGTSTMQVYNESWNDYFVSLKQFLNEYEGASGAIANELDTSWCKECAVIVNNPCAFERTGAAEAHIKLTHNAKFVKVLDKDGNKIPCQTVKKQGKEFDIIFTASVPATGYRVYDIQASEEEYSGASDLKVTEHSLENKNYRILFNRNGDIGSIIDKRLNKEVITSPIKLALMRNIGELNYPSWELRKEDIDAEPYAFANTPSFEIIENGAARIAVKVSRHVESSKIEQIVSLEAGGEYIKVDNFIDWQERRSLLKAVFPFTAANGEAAYDLGIGFIKRSNNSENLYEVPAQKWADITDRGGAFGASVLSDCKYGWDKPSDNTLRLTCIHTPVGAFTKEARQDLQDIGRNLFSFGILSHGGASLSATQKQSEIFNKKLTVFTTSSRREGALSDSFSLLKISSEAAIIRAIKKAEDSNGIIIRINEGSGEEQKGVTLSMHERIISAEEVYSSEEYRKPAKIKYGSLVFDLKPFEIKSFRLLLNENRNTAKETYKKLHLEYNTCGITTDEDKVNVILQGSGCSLPNELLKESKTVHGITFRMPNAEMPKNLLVPRGQTIELPKGMTKLYMLAAGTIGDREITVLTDNKERHITVHDLRAFVGKWDMAGLSQTAEIKNDKIGIELTHLHHPEGNLANQKGYFYLYEIDIRNCKTLTLPEENRVVILAMTAVKRFSNTYLATKLIDEIEKDYEFGDIPPIEKLIDKADFITIRAGKIQEQRKKAKGKGFKKDNIISNIINSYTKSKW